MRVYKHSLGGNTSFELNMNFDLKFNNYFCVGFSLNE